MSMRMYSSAVCTLNKAVNCPGTLIQSVDVIMALSTESSAAAASSSTRSPILTELRSWHQTLRSRSVDRLCGLGVTDSATAFLSEKASGDSATSIM